MELSLLSARCPLLAVPRLIMKIRRQHDFFELDTRYVSGKALYQRAFSRAGLWEKNGSKIQHQSLTGTLQKTKHKALTKTASNVVRYLKENSFSDFRVILRSDLRKVQNKSATQGAQKQLQEKDSIYIEVGGAQGFSQLTPLASFDFSQLDQLIADHRKYYQRPEAPARLDFDTLFFESAAFGYLLHEGLGHRHEGDDHSESLQLKKLPRTNFSVADSPGHEKLLGYTPFDDYGTIGHDVTLFDGATGKTALMSAQTGNARALNHEFHPLIRQRCLIVTTLKKSPIPELLKSLRIEEIRHGRWDGEFLELDISKAVYIDKKLREFRAPPFTLKMKPELITRMKVFGDNKASHPGGGCHKDLQHGLDVSFDTPKAFLSLKNQKLAKNSLEFI